MVYQATFFPVYGGDFFPSFCWRRWQKVAKTGRLVVVFALTTKMIYKVLNPMKAAKAITNEPVFISTVVLSLNFDD